MAHETFAFPGVKRPERFADNGGRNSAAPLCDCLQIEFVSVGEAHYAQLSTRFDTGV